MKRPRLADNVRLFPVYQDETPFGSVISSAADERLRARCAPVLSALRAKSQEIAQVSDALRATLLRKDVLGELYQQPGVLREDCLYPAPEQVRPTGLSVQLLGGTHTADIPLSQRQIGNLAPFIGALSRGDALPKDRDAQELYDALAAAGALTDEEPAAAVTADVTFAGHAMVRFSDRKTALLFDPWVLPTTSGRAYQPLTCSELAADAIFITHSHSDHFDPGTLLRFGADVPIYVPRVERESLLAIDMAYRLRELGFNRVHCVDWFEEVTVGDIRVRALPFYGEQPSVSTAYHPEVRNAGNTYLITAADRRHAVIADAGIDDRGSAVKVASSARASYGPLDLLFGGFRAWAIYPLQYLFSSVARYLLFMPPEEWNVRHKIMNDADQLIDTAESWGAASIVPYAAGGAPWYWEFGLGPTHGAVPSQRHPFDPPPEHVLRAAFARSALHDDLIASPTQVLLLRPGDSLLRSSDGWQKERRAPHAWPYPEDGDVLGENPAPVRVDKGPAKKVDPDLRKRVLMRLLARQVVEQIGAVVMPKDVQEVTNTFRQSYGLLRKEAMQAWLAESGLDLERFSGLMTDMAKVSLVERHYAATFEDELADQRRMASVAEFAQRAVPKGDLRTRVLMRLLARQVAEQIGAVVTPKDVQEVTDAFRRSYGLERKEVMQAWLAKSGLDLPRLSEIMTDMAKVFLLERHYAAAIEEQLADQQGLASAVDFAQRAA